MVVAVPFEYMPATPEEILLIVSLELLMASAYLLARVPTGEIEIKRLCGLIIERAEVLESKGSGFRHCYLVRRHSLPEACEYSLPLNRFGGFLACSPTFTRVTRTPRHAAQVQARRAASTGRDSVEGEMAQAVVHSIHWIKRIAKGQAQQFCACAEPTSTRWCEGNVYICWLEMPSVIAGIKRKKVSELGFFKGEAFVVWHTHIAVIVEEDGNPLFTQHGFGANENG